MSVIYRFKNLNELAAYYHGKAQQYRARLVSPEAKKMKQPDIDHLRGEVFALEMVVHQLRNTVLDNGNSETKA